MCGADTGSPVKYQPPFWFTGIALQRDRGCERRADRRRGTCHESDPGAAVNTCRTGSPSRASVTVLTALLPSTASRKQVHS